MPEIIVPKHDRADRHALLLCGFERTGQPLDEVRVIARAEGRLTLAVAAARFPDAHGLVMRFREIDHVLERPAPYRLVPLGFGCHGWAFWYCQKWARLALLAIQSAMGILVWPPVDQSGEGSGVQMFE